MGRSAMAARKKPPTPPEVSPEPPRVVGGVAANDDERFDRLFRPQSFDDFVGQEKHKQNLRVYVEAAKRRGSVTKTLRKKSGRPIIMQFV